MSNGAAVTRQGILSAVLKLPAKRSQQPYRIVTTGVLFILILLYSLPGISWGHAFPDHSDPRVGSTIAASPDRIRIWFDGDLEPAFSTIMVHNASSLVIDKKDGRLNPSDPRLLEVSVPRLPAGTYRVIWNVVARDGHRTNGDFTFTIK